jgi:hypothetical protein
MVFFINNIYKNTTKDEIKITLTKYCLIRIITRFCERVFTSLLKCLRFQKVLRLHKSQNGIKVVQKLGAIVKSAE